MGLCTPHLWHALSGLAFLPSEQAPQCELAENIVLVPIHWHIHWTCSLTPFMHGRQCVFDRSCGWCASCSLLQFLFLSTHWVRFLGYRKPLQGVCQGCLITHFSARSCKHEMIPVSVWGWWLELKWRYRSVWVFFLWTLVFSLSLILTSRKGIAPSFFSSTVNLIDSNLVLLEPAKSLFTVWPNNNSVIHISNPEEEFVLCLVNGQGFEMFHVYYWLLRVTRVNPWLPLWSARMTPFLLQVLDVKHNPINWNTVVMGWFNHLVCRPLLILPQPPAWLHQLVFASTSTMRLESLSSVALILSTKWAMWEVILS